MGVLAGKIKTHDLTKKENLASSEENHSYPGPPFIRALVFKDFLRKAIIFISCNELPLSLPGEHKNPPE